MKSSWIILFGLLLVMPNYAVSNTLDKILQPQTYVCPPCPHVKSLFKTEVFEHKGICSVCGMHLVENPQSKITNDIDIHNGSGNFVIEGSNHAENRPIPVFYYKPKSFKKDSRVLIVIPGAGRNAWDYRDAWIKSAEKHGVLILSPHYSDNHYPRFWNYNIGRMISDVAINKSKSAIESFKMNKNQQDWIFSDFDRMFSNVVIKLNMKAKSYDLFGHSAGGQILHRLALFSPNNKANRILASNSGWYTVPSFEKDFPYGLRKSSLTTNELDQAFNQKLVLFIGEQDNGNEMRGHLVRNAELDQQGTHRLSRAKHFYTMAKQIAKERKLYFDWKFKVVANTGHDYKAMSKAASNYLYEDDI
jgi:transcription elongation factor Elf1